MSTYKRRKLRKEMQMKSQSRPWISMKTGRRIVWAAALGMAILTALQVAPQKGIAEGVLWGAIFGGLILLIFEGYYRLNTFIRRTSKLDTRR